MRIPSGLRARVGWLPLLAALVPPALIARASYRSALNVPYWDQWPFAAFVVQAATGVLRPADLWMPDDVHRVVIPRLVMLALARSTGWDVRYEVAVNVLLALGTLAVLASLIARTVRPSAPSLVPWLILAASVTLFSMSQWENWTWGWQITYFLNAFAACVTAWALARWGTRWPGPPVLVLAALTSVLSQGVGLPLLGLVPLAVLVMPPRGGGARWRLAALLLAIGVGVAALYASGLTSSPNQPRRIFPTQDPAGFGFYLLTYLGAVFAPVDTSLAARWGAGGLAAFVVGAFWVTLRSPADRTTLVPWLLLGIYPILAGCLIAVGRFGGGLETALQSRYTTTSSLFWVSAPVVVALAVAPAVAATRVGRVAAIALAALVAVAACRSQAAVWALGSAATRARADRLRQGGDCLRYLDWAPDACLQTMCWDAELLRFFAGPLRAERLGPFATVAPEPPLSSYVVVEQDLPGRIDDVARIGRPRNVVVTGWSRTASVLVVVDGVVAVRVENGIARPELAPELARTGWGISLKRGGHHLVEAYGVVDDRHVVKLEGAVVL